jgi:hypothetical protein
LLPFFNLSHYTGISTSTTTDEAPGAASNCKDVKVPPKTTLEVMQGNKLVVQNDGSNADVLRAEASAGSAIDVTISVLEDV